MQRVGIAVVVVCVVAGVGGWAAWTLHRPSTTADAPLSLPDTLPDAREEPRAAPDPDAWFSEVHHPVVARFVHVSGDSDERPFPAANGSGIGLVDYDRDGRPDIFALTGWPFPIESSAGPATNRLMRNLGAWDFADVTESSGGAHHGFSAGVAVGDFDSDGFPDLYVTCYGRNCLWHNAGDGTFLRSESTAGVDDERWGASAAFLDADDDGLLDLYVCNYGKWTLEANPYCGDRQRKVRLFCSPNTIEPEFHAFYHNNGDGTFSPYAEQAGLAARAARGQGVVAADLNDDGHVDLYVANDLNPNMLFLNRGDGTFEDCSESSGAAYDQFGARQAGMGVDVGDVDGDLKFDLFVTNYQDEYNTLYQNLGPGLYQDVSYRRGLAAASLPWIGWGTALLDLNLDGWEDVIVVNGHVDSNRELLGQDAPYEQPPLLWKNVAGRFEPLPAASCGDYFLSRHPARALAAGDMDDDLDVDLIVGHRDRPMALLRNNAVRPGQSGPAVVLRLHGTTANRDAIGSTVTVVGETGRWKRAVKGGGSYLSASMLDIVIALPDTDATYRGEIRWPGGAISQIDRLTPGRRYDIWQPTAGRPARIQSR